MVSSLLYFTSVPWRSTALNTSSGTCFRKGRLRSTCTACAQPSLTSFASNCRQPFGPLNSEKLGPSSTSWHAWHGGTALTRRPTS